MRAGLCVARPDDAGDNVECRARGRGGAEGRRWARGGREAGFDIQDTIPRQNCLSLSPAIKALSGFGIE